MSIYPVKISTWFDGEHLKTMKYLFKFMVEEKSNVCICCGCTVPFKDAYMLHAVPYGYSDFSVWCSKCMGEENEI